MHDASVSLKITGPDYDLLREALRFFQSNEEQVARDASTDVKVRQASRTKAVQADNLLKRIGG